MPGKPELFQSVASDDVAADLRGMSVQTRLAGARELAAVFKRWPNDSHKVYASFRDAQLKLYDTSTPSKLPDAETMKLRADSATRLLENKYSKRFEPDQRLLHPDGNSMYYELITREANRQQQKGGIITAIRATLFGWWRK